MAGFQVQDLTVDDYVLDDGNENCFAGQYRFTDLPSPLSAIAIRGGFWNDPDHRIRYEGRSRATACSFSRVTAKRLHRGGGIVSRSFSSTSASIAPRR